MKLHVVLPSNLVFRMTCVHSKYVVHCINILSEAMQQPCVVIIMSQLIKLPTGFYR